MDIGYAGLLYFLTTVLYIYFVLKILFIQLYLNSIGHTHKEELDLRGGRRRRASVREEEDEKE